MAKYLRLDKKHYGSNGLINLHRGDDWALDGVVVDRYAGYEKPVDLTGFAASGFFEAASGGVAACAVTIPDAKGGQVHLAMSDVDSLNVATNDTGKSIYLVIDAAGQTETVDTLDEAVAVIDRSFQNP